MARATAAELAHALRIDEDDPRLTPLLAAYDPFLTRIIGKSPVPEPVQKEALILIAAYAYDRPITPGSSWVAILRNSGAQNLMGPWVKRSAGVIGQTDADIGGQTTGQTADIPQSVLDRIPSADPGPNQMWATDDVNKPDWRDIGGGSTGHGRLYLNDYVLSYGICAADGTNRQEMGRFTVTDMAVTIPFEGATQLRPRFYFEFSETRVLNWILFDNVPFTDHWTKLEGENIWYYNLDASDGSPYVMDIFSRSDVLTPDPFSVDKATNTLVDNEEDDEAYMTVRTTFRAIARRVKQATMRIPGIAYIVRQSDVDAATKVGVTEDGLDNTRMMTIRMVFRFVREYVSAEFVKNLLESLRDNARLDATAIKGLSGSAASSGWATKPLVPESEGFLADRNGSAITNDSQKRQYRYLGRQIALGGIPAEANALYLTSDVGIATVVAIADLETAASYGGAEFEEVHFVQYNVVSNQFYFAFIGLALETGTRRLLARIVRQMDPTLGRDIQGTAGASNRFDISNIKVDYIV